jgi:hypothetical protein
MTIVLRWRVEEGPMAMKETEGWLRAYFLIAGAISVVSARWLVDDATSLSRLPLPASWLVALWLPIMTRVALGSLFIAAGLRLKAALRTDATWILRMLMISGGVLGLELLQAWLTWSNTTSWYAEARLRGALLHCLVGLAIAAYLILRVGRLSNEARTGDAKAAGVTLA